MRNCLLILGLCFSVILSRAQGSDAIIDALRAINKNILNTPCTFGNGMIISNRAMNRFLSNKIGSYLSVPADLSFYKNSITVNSGDRSLAVNHNLYTANDMDERVRSLMSVGAKAGIADQFGLMIKQTWIGKGRSYFPGCQPWDSSFNGKQYMDAQRAVILQQLEIEIARRRADFETTLYNIAASDLPGQQVDTVKIKMRTEFVASLKDEFLQRFHELQSSALIEKNAYRLITSNWTSIRMYIPVLSRNYHVLASAAFVAERKNTYEWELAIRHTRFFEGSRMGRLFLTLEAMAYQNNSAAANLLPKTSSTGVYTGKFDTFITPVFMMQLIYVPPDWHFGLSAMLQQYIGTYRALDGKLGLPVVLIDKRGDPAVNLEFQLRFADINHQLLVAGSRTSVAVTVGIPLSRIAF